MSCGSPVSQQQQRKKWRGTGRPLGCPGRPPTQKRVEVRHLTMVMACCAEWRHRCRGSSSSLASPLAAWFACAAGGVSSSRYTVDDALNKCGTWDAFHWLMLFYCGLSWMCDVSHWAQGQGATT